MMRLFFISCSCEAFVASYVDFLGFDTNGRNLWQYWGVPKKSNTGFLGKDRNTCEVGLMRLRGLVGRCDWKLTEEYIERDSASLTLSPRDNSAVA